MAGERVSGGLDAGQDHISRARFGAIGERLALEKTVARNDFIRHGPSHCGIAAPAVRKRLPREGRNRG